MAWIDPWWTRVPDGRIRLTLAAGEASVILRLIAEVRELLGGPGDDPVMQRLFPRAYLDPTEESAETTWRALAGPDLLRERLDRLDRIEVALGAIASGDVAFVELDDEAQADWMGVINDTRLALGTALGVRDNDPDEDTDDDLDADWDSDDWDSGDRGPDADGESVDPAGPARHLYHVLTYRQEELVALLLGAMPTDGLDDF